MGKAPEWHCFFLPSSFEYSNIDVLLLPSSQSDGAPDFVTPVSASQPVPSTPGVIHHASKALRLDNRLWAGAK